MVVIGNGHLDLEEVRNHSEVEEVHRDHQDHQDHRGHHRTQVEVDLVDHMEVGHPLVEVREDHRVGHLVVLDNHVGEGHRGQEGLSCQVEVP